ncbi:GNAT family N-acetyltransferase [Sulfitobacter sp. G21635-S1]|uniref:GNAT family N-acetyltransferase n=1 Tax=Sulfitobacter sp. G21635-S1 TaxID=3014043 RepID=UPI0022AFC2A2|nr:GNAT family N-acetyltransferase [Sulfitobacter sp. G21635-S1]MCZ4257805.1 GNAT family N-acetyltransferase [Sulfitobacter sp. G21635-S1]
MNVFPEVIADDDIHMRPMVAGDTPTILRHLGDLDIARWMAATKQPFGSAEAEEIQAIGQDPDRRLRVIELGGVMVGCLCLVPDLWFWMDPAFRGRGFMSRSLRAAITAHFATLAPPLLATCREDNQASRAVLSSLGFSRKLQGRRMFFQSEGRALACLDHVMTPEQWMALNPPVQVCGPATLRPATQRDAPGLMHLLPLRDEDVDWPTPEALSRFIEEHRCRYPGRGLFVIEDDHRRLVGVMLRNGTDVGAVRFLTPDDAVRYMPGLVAAIPGLSA